MFRRADAAIIVILFAANLLVRTALAAAYSFDGLYGQDAYAYYDFAREIVEGRANTAFHWPLGYPLILAAGFTVFGVSAGVGQAISMLLGAALAPLVYVLGRLLGCRVPCALAAALLMTVCGQALQSSVVLMSDVPALFWALVSAVALFRYARSEQAGWLALAAFALAWASITRWIYLTLALPWALAVLLLWIRNRRVRWPHGALAAAAAALIFIPQVIYSLGENPYSWTAWTLANAFRSEFADTQGRLVYPQVNALFFASFLYDPYYLSPVFLPLAIAGAITQRRFAAVTLLGWLLAPYLFSIGMPQQNIRFLLTSFPAAAVLVGVGMEQVVERLTRKRTLGYAAMVMLIFAGLLHTTLTSRGVIDTFVRTQKQHKEAVIWAAAQIPPDATVYTFGVTLIMQHDTALNVYEIYYETPQTLTSKWVRGRDDYLLLDIWHVEHQWQGHAPQIVYHWLRDQRGLTQLGRHGGYTLFRVAG